MQLVDTLKRIWPGSRDVGADHAPDAGDTSHDSTLEAFKAELAERAEKNTRRIPGEWQSRRT